MNTDGPCILILATNDEICLSIAQALWEELGTHVPCGRIDDPPVPPYDEVTTSFTWNARIAGLSAVIYAEHKDERTREGLKSLAERILQDLYDDTGMWHRMRERLGANYELVP